MKNKNDELQKMFCEMDETINVEELMEVKGGGIDPPKCSAEGAGMCVVAHSGVCNNGGV